MAGEELIELKFRLSDGSDIGPNKYNPTTTVGFLKEIILSQWPQGCTTSLSLALNFLLSSVYLIFFLFLILGDTI